MTYKSVFSYFEYKVYLDALFRMKKGNRGLKSRLAVAAGIQPAYLSQVLHDKAHLSLEQAEAASRFLQHSEDEHEYFLLMIQRDRSGTFSLKKHFEKKLTEILQHRLQVAKRIEQQTTLDPTQQAIYYSSWLYAAIHMIVSLPHVNTKEEIAQYLRADSSRVHDVLEFLLQHGLVIKDGNELKVGTARVFLGNSSKHILRHHANWRQQAIDSLDRETNRDLHYSSVFTISVNDAATIKDKLLEAIKANADVIKQSGEEELFAISVDFFSVNKK